MARHAMGGWTRFAALEGVPPPARGSVPACQHDAAHYMAWSAVGAGP